MRSFAAGQFVDEDLLLCLHLHQTLQLDVVAFQLGLLLVQVVIEFHHLAFTVLGLAFPFVSFAQSSQLLLFNSDSEVVQTFSEGAHILIEGDDFGDELHG